MEQSRRDTRDWSSLPERTLALHMFSGMSAQDALRAGLACSTWRAGADGAITSIASARPGSGFWLRSWLQDRGQSVSSITLDDSDGQPLPCSNLRALVISGGTVTPPMLSPSLTKLVLESEWKLSTTGEQQQEAILQQLRGMTNLQHLALDALTPIRGSEARHEQSAYLLIKLLERSRRYTFAGAAFWEALQPLQHLTTLKLALPLQGSILEGAARTLPHLTALQELSLTHIPAPQPVGAPAASAADATDIDLRSLQLLTKLELSGPFDLTRQLSSVGNLTQLRSLSLEDCTCSIEVPSCFTALESLTLTNISGLSKTQVFGFMASQSQLKHVSLALSPSTELAIALTVAAAITNSSSYLQHLDLSGVHMRTVEWFLAFRKGALGFTSPLSQLTRLVGPAALNADTNHAFDVNKAIVEALLDACPALQDLECGPCVPFRAELSGLQHLTRLVIKAPADPVAAAALASITTLQQLIMKSDGPLESYMLAPLVSSQFLTELILDEGSAGVSRSQQVLSPADDSVPSDTAISALGQLTRLTKLTIVSSKLTEGHLGHLSTLTRLEYLQIPYHQGLEAVRRRLLWASTTSAPQQTRTIVVKRKVLVEAIVSVPELLQHCLSPSYVCTLLERELVSARAREPERIAEVFEARREMRSVQERLDYQSRSIAELQDQRDALQAALRNAERALQQQQQPQDAQGAAAQMEV